MFIPLLYIIFVVLPVVFWTWFFRSSDTGDKEPKMMILRLFLLWGFVASMLALVGNSLLDGIIPGFSDVAEKIVMEGARPESLLTVVGFLLCVIFEELAKFIALWSATYYAKCFTQIVDGIIYGVSVALGFAFLENTFYFLEFIKMDLQGIELLVLVIMRAVNSLIMHLVTAGIMGLYMGRKKFSPSHSKRYLFQGVMIAILIHAAFNMSLLLIGNGISVILTFAIMFAGLSYLIWQVAKKENHMVWKICDEKVQA